MSTFLKWIVLSSEDPKQVALTIRGIILLSVPTIIGLLGEAGINVMESQVAQYVAVATALIGALLAVVGMIRKLYNYYSEDEIVVFKSKKK